MEINQTSMEKALHYLGESEEDYAEALSRLKASEHRLKVAYSAGYLEVDGKNVEERKARAFLTEDYKQALEGHENAVYDKEIISAKPKRAETTVDVWRSINSSRNRGNIV